MGVGERPAVDGEVQVREVLDDGRLHPVEGEFSAVHIGGGHLVHDARKHLGPQDHLEGDKEDQHQAQEAQQDVPYDPSRFHSLCKDSENMASCRFASGKDFLYL